MIHYIDEYLQKGLHPITIDLIGIGGTGSLVLTRLARMDYALKKLGHNGLIVNAYDFDIVEENNIGRQNFFHTDLERNKAECLIEKINIAFGVKWNSFPTKYNNKMESNIVITCVDNVETRTRIQKEFRKKAHNNRNNYNTNYYWLDTGNGKDFGQIVLGSKKIPQPKSEYKTIEKLKTIVEQMGSLKKFDTEEQQGMEGCSYASSMTKQDLFINDIISCYACDLLWKLIRNNYITMNGTFVNLQKGLSKGISISL